MALEVSSQARPRTLRSSWLCVTAETRVGPPSSRSPGSRAHTAAQPMMTWLRLTVKDGNTQQPAHRPVPRRGDIRKGRGTFWPAGGGNTQLQALPQESPEPTVGFLAQKQVERARLSGGGAARVSFRQTDWIGWDFPPPLFFPV